MALRGLHFEEASSLGWLCTSVALLMTMESTIHEKEFAIIGVNVTLAI
jgi:hypothetical protein